MINSVLRDRDLKKKRNKLILNSSVSLDKDETVSLYVDSSFLPDAKGRDTLYKRELSPTNIFASLRTPIVDITISNGKIHEIKYHPDDMKGKMPHEVDLEKVLNEVDRVAFSKTLTFDTHRVLAIEPKKKIDPFTGMYGATDWGRGRDYQRLRQARITIESPDGGVHRLHADDVEVSQERRMVPNFPSGSLGVQGVAGGWASTSSSASISMSVKEEVSLKIIAHNVK